MEDVLGRISGSSRAEKEDLEGSTARIGFAAPTIGWR